MTDNLFHQLHWAVRLLQSTGKEQVSLDNPSTLVVLNLQCPPPTSSPEWNLAMFRNIFDCSILGRVTTGISWVKGRDAAKYTTVHRTPPHTQQLQGLK